MHAHHIVRMQTDTIHDTLAACCIVGGDQYEIWQQHLVRCHTAGMTQGLARPTQLSHFESGPKPLPQQRAALPLTEGGVLLLPPRQDLHTLSYAIIQQPGVVPRLHLRLHLVPEAMRQARKVIVWFLRCDFAQLHVPLVVPLLGLVHLVSIAARVLPVHNEASWVGDELVPVERGSNVKHQHMGLVGNTEPREGAAGTTPAGRINTVVLQTTMQPALHCTKHSTNSAAVMQ